MNANRKSDGFVVPATTANKGAAEAPAEPSEERDPAKRNAKQSALRRTPSRKRKLRGLHGVREAARKDRNFTPDSRQEPYEVIPHVRICAGGRRKRRFLPRWAEGRG